MEVKKWYRSKTLWVNGLSLAVGFLTYVAGADFIPPSVMGVVLGVVVPCLNVVLRFLTEEPIMNRRRK